MALVVISESDVVMMAYLGWGVGWGEKVATERGVGGGGGREQGYLDP